MTQIHRALAHYWHLRDQDVAPDAARNHVLHRFGVALDPETLSTSGAKTAPVEVPAAGTRFRDFADDMCVVIEPRSYDRLGPSEFVVKYLEGSPAGQTLVCDVRDLGDDDAGLGLKPVPVLMETVISTASNPQGLYGTA